MAGFLKSSGSDLVSGVPRQITGTFFERLLIPFIHFMLLAFDRGWTRPEWPLVIAAVACGYAIRLVSAARYRQSWLDALLHPLGVLVFLGIQWTAWIQARRGVAAVWKGRAYGGCIGGPPA